MRMRRRGLALVSLVAVAIMLAGCAGNRISTVISIQSKATDDLVGIKNVVKDNQAGLQTVNCGTRDGKPVDCYVAIMADLGQVAIYNDALATALKASNTTDAKKAIADMTGVVETWLNTGLLKVPANAKLPLQIGLEAMRTVLLVMSSNLGV